MSYEDDVACLSVIDKALHSGDAAKGEDLRVEFAVVLALRGGKDHLLGYFQREGDVFVGMDIFRYKERGKYENCEKFYVAHGYEPPFTTKAQRHKERFLPQRHEEHKEKLMG